MDKLSTTIVSTSIQGVINIIYLDKGFGFIRRNRGKDIFFLISDLPDNTNIVIGTNVIFDIHNEKYQHKSKLRAFNIKIQ